MSPFELYLESDQADDDYDRWCEQHQLVRLDHWRARWEGTADCADAAQQWIDDLAGEHRLAEWERDRAEGLA